ncbi:tetratricopeptide repeat protein [Sphingomonas baiyangensis]|uniref:tetratricopeptide repeat protein n=1 Tax=Sphingomonas baiyangensis TaxID=2572576 RepID=UPI00146B0EB4|nr:tetratricopeptide repeat protein [Sphingomonas baiyangensis]
MRRTIVVAAMALAGLVVAFLGLRALLPDFADRDTARTETARALALFEAGNVSAARDAAQAATTADHTLAIGHAVLARMQIALGDGVGADASLARAAAAGLDMARVQHLRAEALLLQRETRRASLALDGASQRYRPYVERVRAQLFAQRGDYAGAERQFAMLVEQYPRDAAAWQALASFHADNGDVARAIAASDRALSLDRRPVDALLLRAQLVRGQYGLVAALPWFEEALKRDPRHHDALIDYAATLGDAGRPRAMLAAVRRATEMRRNSPRALYLQAVLAARAQRFGLARSILQRAGGSLAGLPGAQLLGGILAMESGGHEQAIAAFGDIVGAQPMNREARQLLATAYLRSGAAREGVRALQPVVRRGDADTLSLLLAARGHERIGERGPAAELIDRAAIPARAAAPAFMGGRSLASLQAEAATSGGAPDRIIAFIRGLAQAGDLQRAYREADALAAAHPGVPAAHLLVGDVLMIGRRPADAAIVYARAANLRYDQPVMLRLVEALEAAGNRAQAAQVLATYLSQNPEDVVALRLSARWQLAAGEYDAAIDALERLRLRLGNRDAALLAELAIAYVAVDEADRAVRLGAAAYALAPQNAAIGDAYGQARRAGGDLAGAAQLFAKAARIAPQHAGIKANMAAATDELRAVR